MSCACEGARIVLMNSFVFPDEINWPEGEDAPPPDAQELITLLLRQNPLERLGTGANTKKSKETVLLLIT